MTKVKYPNLLKVIRRWYEEEVERGIIPESRLEACIQIDYRNHCTAIGRNIESEAYATWRYNPVGPCPKF